MNQVQPLGLPITEKLANDNLTLWKAQVMPAIRGAQLEGFLDGTAVPPPVQVDAKVGEKTIKVANPEYAQWIAQDQ